VKVRPSDGRVLMNVSLTSTPLGLAFDGVNIWVGLRDGNGVAKIRTSDGAILDTYSLTGSPENITFDGTKIWVTLPFANSVQLLSAADGTSVGTIPFPYRPTAITFDGTNIWVGTGDAVRKFSIDGAFLATYPVDFKTAAGLVSDGTNMWASIDLTDSVKRIPK
jgi:hypothetical protein